MRDFGFRTADYAKWQAVQNKANATANARERAFLMLRDKIIYMDLKPGEPVSDKLLAEQLEMSRTPVREALILLSAYNMVVLKPQSGTFVAPIDSEQVAVEQFSRMAMEKEIIKLACAKKSDGLAEAYSENIRLFRDCNMGSDPNRIRRLHDLDNNFHGLAFASVGKVNSFRHMHSYMQHIERLRVLTLTMGADQTINDDHEKIARAIIEGDKQAAITALEEHLSFYRKTLKLAETQYPEYFVLG